VHRKTLGVETLHTATPSALVTINFHLLVRVHSSREFHLDYCCSGSRIEVELTEDVSVSPCSRSYLRKAPMLIIVHSRAPSSSMLKTLEKTRQGRSEIIGLNICEKHAVKKNE
jgi:hypothetical protein